MISPRSWSDLIKTYKQSSALRASSSWPGQVTAAGSGSIKANLLGDEEGD